MTRVVAGVDLGGTASRLVIAAAGVVLASRTFLTRDLGQGDPATRVSRLAESISALVPPGQELGAVGIGASGPVHRKTGTVHNLDTLPSFSEIPLVAGLRARLGVPVEIDNDAVVAAIGEGRIGAGRGCDRMLMVTLGTGVGVALLVGGRPFRGLDDAHPEAGHIPIVTDGRRCYCGAEGCWEQVASRTALQDRVRPYMPADLAARDLLPAAAERVSEPAIRNAYNAYGSLVGRGLAVLHTLYMPDVTVLGGSAAEYLPLFAQAITKSLDRKPGFAIASRLVAASLGDESGALGAALMVDDLP